MDKELVIIEGRKEDPKKYEIKGFTKHRDYIVGKLMSQGVMFYSININYPHYWAGDRNFEPRTLEEAWKSIRYEVLALRNHYLDDTDLIEFAYIVIESHKAVKDPRMAGYPHIHMLVGVRSLLGDPGIIKLDLMERLLSAGYTDIDIHYLRTNLDVGKYWNYIVKETNYKEGGIGKDGFKNHYFYQFHVENGIYGKFYDFLMFEDLPYPQDAEIGNRPHRHDKIVGLTNPKGKDKYVLINLWVVFMQLTGMFHYNGKLYQRNYISRYSYELLGDLNILKLKTDEMLQILSKVFIYQMRDLDMRRLMSDYFEDAIKTVNNNPLLLPTRRIMLNLIEFKDGIYNLSIDMFLGYQESLHKGILKELDDKLTCVKYYDITYHNLTKPDFWLSRVAEQLAGDQRWAVKGLNKEQTLKEFCSHFGRLFHTIPPPFEIPKKNAVMVIGQSNTGKTTLVADILYELFGKENIGIIGDDGTFAFEQLEHKAVIVNDEFKYNKSNRSNALKLIERKPFLMNSKYKKKHEVILDAPVLLLSNEKQNDVLIQDDAFLNRIAIYSFNKKLAEGLVEKNIHKKIAEELPKIVVYCNRLFVNKHYVQRRFRIRNDNKKTIQKITGMFLPKNKKISDTESGNFLPK